MRNTISIIVPVFHAAGTLRKCVESLVLGTEKEIEVILVDDCSSDGSWKVCQELKEEFSNVRCYRNEKNKGVSYTRNFGMEVANGQWIMFVDSDDWVSCRFISALTDTADQYEDCLVTCGFHYVDEVNGRKTPYQWDRNMKQSLIEISKEELFDAMDRIMLQNVWNKIFRSDVIKRYEIRFNEELRMGEDFAFVLDYMQAADLRKCMVINDVLYYYVRGNGTSLMSHFGWTTVEPSFQRIEQLAKISGIENKNIKYRLDYYKNKLVMNCVYHVVFSSKCTKREKIEHIRKITGRENAERCYLQYRSIYIKQKLKNFLLKTIAFSSRVSGKIQRKRMTVQIKKEKRKLNAQNFSIISQNCIGGVFYHDMGMKFLSPTINLFFKEPDFIRFISNLKYYVSLDPEMRWEEEYPVGRLDDIEVHFMHYSTCKEAKDIWNRRKLRINFDKIIVLATDRNGFTDETYKEWKKIPYKKLLFTVKREYENRESIVYPEYAGNGFVPDLMEKREFYRNDTLMNCINNMK